MKINQLSLFIENKVGKLAAPSKLLAEAGINICTLTLADTEEFGILRMIVNDWQKGKDTLESAGYAVKVTEVLALPVNDKPGGFMQVMNHIDACQLNIEYVYAFASKCNEQAVLIFRFEDSDTAIKALQDKGLNPLDPVELFS